MLTLSSGKILNQVNLEMHPSVNMSSFTDMLNSEFSEYHEFVPPTPNTLFSQSFGEETADGTHVTPEDISSQKAKERRRTKNFTKQEDEMLISAWQNVSLDPVTGVDQTKGTYWQRIHSYFMSHKDFDSDRSASSLTHRWSVIQLAVNKFQGFYNQVDRRSGYSENDKVIFSFTCD